MSERDWCTGFHPAPDGALGVWIVEIPGRGGFARDAVLVLTQLAVERPPGPAREVLERIRDAFIEASPSP